MTDWLSKISKFFVDLVKDLLTAIVELLKDVLLWVLEGLLEAVRILFYLIPEPSFLTPNWMGDLLSPLPPFALFVISQIPFQTAFGIIAAGVTFYLARKLLTLGQW